MGCIITVLTSFKQVKEFFSSTPGPSSQEEGNTEGEPSSRRRGIRKGSTPPRRRGIRRGEYEKAPSYF